MQELRQTPQMIALQISPINAQGELGGNYNDAQNWMVMAIATDNTVGATYRTTPAADLERTLTQATLNHPEAGSKISFRGLNDAGDEIYIEPCTTDELADTLMETICDDTPDDAPNTDDHPLEEVRTALYDTAEQLDPA